MIKEITLEFLEKIEACQEGINRWKEKGLAEVVPEIRALMSDDHLEWANWFITRVMTEEQKIRYAIYAAEQVISIYEKKCPNDSRPRQAILATKNYLKNKTTKNKEADHAAADAAADAAYANHAAAYANHAAAYAADAAYAAYAAYAAADAAHAATSAVYAAAVKKEMQIKILNYGIGLLQSNRSI